jgi:V/A-type H+-transporting ATPase subunit E
MKSLETGKDKIQKICDAIRKETLDPVKQEVSEIIENAHMKAAEIVREAEARAATLTSSSDSEMEEKKKLFQSSLALACRQGIESLKQKIEQELFNKELSQLVIKETSSENMIVKLIESFMRSLENQGIEEDFEAIIPKDISARSINTVLAKSILERLKQHTVELGDFRGGVKLRMEDRKITIDISDEVIKELVGNYIRRDFRDLIFQV